MELNDKEWQIVEPCFPNSRQDTVGDLGVEIEKY